MKDLLSDLSVCYRQFIEDGTNKSNFLLRLGTNMGEVQLVAAGEPEVLGVCLNHLHKTRGIDVCMFLKFDTPRVGIGVDFFYSEGCCF